MDRRLVGHRSYRSCDRTALALTLGRARRPACYFGIHRDSFSRRNRQRAAMGAGRLGNFSRAGKPGSADLSFRLPASVDLGQRGVRRGRCRAVRLLPRSSSSRAESRSLRNDSIARHSFRRYVDGSLGGGTLAIAWLFLQALTGHPTHASDWPLLAMLGALELLYLLACLGTVLGQKGGFIGLMVASLFVLVGAAPSSWGIRDGRPQEAIVSAYSLGAILYGGFRLRIPRPPIEATPSRDL